MKKLFLILPILFISCMTPQKAVKKCNQLSAKYPEAFEKFQDTVEIIKEIEAKQSEKTLSLKNKPVKFQTDWGVSGYVQIAPGRTVQRDSVKVTIQRHARTDTIIKTVPRYKLTPRPKFYRNKFFIWGFGIGVVFGVLAFVFILVAGTKSNIFF